MKLQINQRGSWRDVVEFDDTRDMFVAVAEATIPLATALAATGDGKPITWRITEKRKGGSPRVIAYLEPPKFKWSKR